MINYSDLWPPYGLMIIAGDLRLSPITDDDIPGLVELAQAGIHDPAWMPFAVPWTRAPAEELPRRYASHYWEQRATFSTESFGLDFAVRLSRGDEEPATLIGVQGMTAQNYPITRTGETGSWLGQAHQGRRLGTRMRQAFCEFLFDHLGAAQITSVAFADNQPSLGVSRKVGYSAHGVDRLARDGELALSQRLVLDPENLVRGDPITVSGAEPLQRFLGIS